MQILGGPDGNPVRSVLLLADGQDETIFEESLKSTAEVLLKRHKYPTYTFGFGRDHDPRTLYYLATSGYGSDREQEHPGRHGALHRRPDVHRRTGRDGHYPFGA